MPELSNDVPELFCDGRIRTEDLHEIDVNALFAEVDAQLLGKYRLAGGHVENLTAQLVEKLTDPEDQHAYHRLYWITRYATAACFGHRAAEAGLISSFKIWLETDWHTSPVIQWPYTLAERIASLTTALFWIQASGRASMRQLIVPMKSQMWVDAKHLARSIEYNLGIHNHLLNNARGLFLAGLILGECNDSAEWRDQAFAIWDEYFPALVFEDGTFAEQSSHYHLLLSRTALEYALACRRAKRPVAQGFQERLAAMFKLSNVLVREDGSLPRFGDNSPDCTGADLAGLLPAAYHHGFLNSVPRHRAITPLTIFYCGAAPELPASTDTTAFNMFPAGGFLALRSLSLDAELVAHGDERGNTGTHGDAGSGSYELWWKGNVLVREPGSFSQPMDSRSAFYHSAQAQNVTTIDSLSPTLTKEDARFLAQWYWPQGGSWKKTRGGAAYQCQAFGRLDEGLMLSRRWRFEGPDELIFDEAIDGQKEIAFESRICLGDASWKLSCKKNGDEKKRFEWKSADGRTAHMAIAVPKAIRVELQPCRFLPEYGVEKEGRLLLLSGFLALPFSWSIQWRFDQGFTQN